MSISQNKPPPNPSSNFRSPRNIYNKRRSKPFATEQPEKQQRKKEKKQKETLIFPPGPRPSQDMQVNVRNTTISYQQQQFTLFDKCQNPKTLRHSIRISRDATTNIIQPAQDRDATTQPHNHNHTTTNTISGRGMISK